MLFKYVDNIKQARSVSSPLTDTAVKKETRVSSPLMFLSIIIYPLIKCSLEASSWVPAPLYSEQKICVQAIWKSQLLNQISYLTLILFFRHATWQRRTQTEWSTS